jgi:hypothetical protein
MDTREQPHSPSVTIIKIITHSPSRRTTVSAVEGVQLPSPFRLGSYALATAWAPVSQTWLPARRGENISVTALLDVRKNRSQNNQMKLNEK